MCEKELAFKLLQHIQHFTAQKVALYCCVHVQYMQTVQHLRDNYGDLICSGCSIFHYMTEMCKEKRNRGVDVNNTDSLVCVRKRCCLHAKVHTQFVCAHHISYHCSTKRESKWRALGLRQTHYCGNTTACLGIKYLTLVCLLGGLCQRCLESLMHTHTHIYIYKMCAQTQPN